MLTLRSIWKLLCSTALVLAVACVPIQAAYAAQESGSVGIEGTIPAPPPTVGATISLPINGSTVTSIPIQVSGICPNDLLVKLFKNGVFAGSAQCTSGSFQITVDLFGGTNELIARVFDSLDQQGPDSNVVVVTYLDNSSNGNVANRPTLTSNYAKRGADPKADLSWPILLSGGTGPYAISIDWGDGKTDLMSLDNPKEFVIKHAYENSGIYKLIVKAVDARDAAAYLQLVAVANGPLSQTNETSGENTTVAGSKTTIIIWWPAVILLPFIISTFWLGKRYEKQRIKRNVEEGKRPF